MRRKTPTRSTLTSSPPCHCRTLSAKCLSLSNKRQHLFLSNTLLLALVCLPGAPRAITAPELSRLMLCSTNRVLVVTDSQPAVSHWMLWVRARSSRWSLLSSSLLRTPCYPHLLHHPPPSKFCPLHWARATGRETSICESAVGILHNDFVIPSSILALLSVY